MCQYPRESFAFFSLSSSGCGYHVSKYATRDDMAPRIRSLLVTPLGTWAFRFFACPVFRECMQRKRVRHHPAMSPFPEVQFSGPWRLAFDSCAIPTLPQSISQPVNGPARPRIKRRRAHIPFLCIVGILAISSRSRSSRRFCIISQSIVHVSS